MKRTAKMVIDDEDGGDEDEGGGDVGCDECDSDDLFANFFEREK